MIQGAADVHPVRGVDAAPVQQGSGTDSALIAEQGRDRVGLPRAKLAYVTDRLLTAARYTPELSKLALDGLREQIGSEVCKTPLKIAAAQTARCARVREDCLLTAPHERAEQRGALQGLDSAGLDPFAVEADEVALLAQGFGAGFKVGPVILPAQVELAALLVEPLLQICDLRLFGAAGGSLGRPAAKQ